MRFYPRLYLRKYYRLPLGWRPVRTMLEEAVALPPEPGSPVLFWRNLSFNIFPVVHGPTSFEGWIRDDGFEIHRPVYGRTFIVPYAYGEVLESNNGLELLRVTFTMQKFMAALYVALLLLLGILTVLSITDWITSDIHTTVMIQATAIPLVIAYFYGVAIFSVRTEGLLHLLEGKIGLKDAAAL